MANATRDQNRVKTALGVSSDDGITPQPIEVNPVSQELVADILFNPVRVTVPGVFIPRDSNRVTVICGVSSVDGITPTPIAVAPDNGALLVDNN